MSLDTNLNVSPYFDDFDETKNYHRILFKPTTAVQTRELNQIQSILQNQIERFGNAIYKDGSVVSGCAVSYFNTLNFVRLQDRYINNNLILIDNLSNCFVVSQTTGLAAKIINYASGTEQNYPNTNRVYINYINSGQDSDGNEYKYFRPNEVLDFYSGSISANVVVGSARSIASNTAANTFTNGIGYGLKISDGIVYQKGFFIRVDEQSTVVSDELYDGANNLVGFLTNEFIINSDQDSSLNDNSLGYINDTAPGADRLKLVANLNVVSTNAISNTNNFAALVQYINGIPVMKNENAQYSAIGDEMARRTYETNGNFVVNPFTVSTSSGNNTHISVNISPGSSYTQGHRVELIRTATGGIRKGNNLKYSSSQLITTNYGNFVIVDDFAGTFDFTQAQDVEIWDTPQNALTNKTFGFTNVLGTRVGYATVRSVNYLSGTPGTPSAQYQLFIYNIRMDNGKSFSNDAKSFYFNGSTKGIADIILDQYNTAVIRNPERRALVWSFGTRAINTLKDAANNINTQYILRQKSTSSLAVDGTISLTLTTSHAGGSHKFPYGLGVVGDGNENDFMVVALANTETGSLAGSVTAYSTNTLVTGSGTSFVTNFSVNDYIRIGSNIRRVTSIANNTTINIDAALSSNVSANVYSRYIPQGYVFPFSDLMVGTRNINITSNTSATFNTGLSAAGVLTTSVPVAIYHNVLRFNTVPAKKNIRKNVVVKIDTTTHVNGTKGPWNLGLPNVHRVRNVYAGVNYSNTNSDIMSSCYFDTGQKDTHYDMGSISLKQGAVATNTKILVVLDVLTPNTSPGIGFFSVDSYPIDDANTTNTNAITTADIPVYVSETGSTYSLRDCVDFRPYKAATATITTDITNATVNPAASTSFNIDTDGTYVPCVDENLETDLSYYLGRKDIVYFTTSGLVKVKEGAADENPITPSEPDDGMAIAVLNIQPYPSLSSTEVSSLADINKTNKTFIRDTSYATSSNLVTYKRYRMQDIKTIDDRVARLEYYVSLNLLEQATSSLQVPDTNGLDRFKNGFFVDPFTNFSFSDVSNPEFNIAIDSANGIARPCFTEERPELTYNTSTSTNIVQNSRILTLPYTTSIYQSQPYATQYRNAAPVEFRWNGSMTLYPVYGHNIDTTITPSVNVTLDLATPWLDFANSPFGTQWGDWRVSSSQIVTSSSSIEDTPTATTTTSSSTTQTTTTNSRDGTSLSVSTSTSSYNLGTYVNDVQAQPYIASREIAFFASGLRPNTRLHAFFDNVLVDASVALGVKNTTVIDTSDDNIVTRTTAWGSPLYSSSDGTIYGKFLIPANKFLTGDRLFELADVDSLNTGTDSITTSATAAYTSSNFTLTKSSTTLTTVNPEVNTSSVSQTQSTTTAVTTTNITSVTKPVSTPTPTPNNPSACPEGPDLILNGVALGQPGRNDIWIDCTTGLVYMIDPLAQGFRLNSGIATAGQFMPGITVYFKKKPTDNSHGLTLYVVESLNGYPDGTKIIPLTKTWLPNSSINVSDDGTVGTTFMFEAPVYLQNNKMYNFVTKPDGGDPDYLVWTAKLGDFDVATGVQVSSRPVIDSAFISGNQSTWSALQDEFVKFDLLICEFTSNLGYASFVATPTDYLTIGNLQNANSSVSPQVGDWVYGSSNTSVTTANASIRGRVTSINNANGFVELDQTTGLFNNTSVIQFHRVPSSNTTLDANTFIASSSLVSIDDAQMNAVVPRFATLQPAGTSIIFNFKGVSPSYTKDSIFTPMTLDNETEMFDFERIVPSRSNEVKFASGNRLLEVQAGFKSDSRYLSPVIDLVRANILSIGNLIDVTSIDLTDEYTNNGRLKAKYVSKIITLKEGQDSEDLKVFLTAYKPVSSEIKMYAKFLNTEDSESIANKTWTPLNIDNDGVVSNFSNVNDYREFQFSLGSSIPNGAPSTTAYLHNTNGIVYENTLGSMFNSYRSFQIKIVLLSDTTARVPRLNDVRALAIML